MSMFWIDQGWSPWVGLVERCLSTINSLQVSDGGERGAAGGRAVPHAWGGAEAGPDAVHPGRERAAPCGVTPSSITDLKQLSCAPWCTI